MKRFFQLTLLFAVLAATTVISSCGYRNPYVYSGPEKSIYVTTWSNRTSVLLLDSKIYQSLIKWYQKSGSLSITKQKEGADYILAGEIISYNLPSLAYGSGNDASEVKLRLNVRYIFKDLNTDKVLFEQPKEVWIEEYKITGDASETRDNADQALETIIDELSQKIYQRSLVAISGS